MIKKYWQILSILLIASMLLVACGSETVNETIEPIEPIATIRIWADDTRSQILMPLAEEFLAEYQVEVIIEEVASIRDQFNIAAPAGEGPDIFLGAHDWLGELVANGLLAPIELGDKADSFTEVAVKGCTYAGELYCMPYATENMGFFYNTDMVDTPPTTWDEVITIGTALMDEGTVTYGLVLSGTTYDAFPLQTSFGGYIFGRDADGNYNPADLGVNSEGMVAAGNWIADQIASGFLSNNIDWDTAHVLFETGESPFLMAGPWALERIGESGIPYAITNFPGGGVPFAGVQGFFVNALSENVLLAQTFLTEFVATDAVMQDLLEAGNRPSAFKSVAEATDNADLAALGEAGADAMLMPAIPEMGSVWGAWSDGFVLIINGDATPEDALATAEAQIIELMGGLYEGMVNVPGSWQGNANYGCNWDPACLVTFLTEGDDGLFSGSFNIPAGDHEVKIAISGGWGENYGVDGVGDGDNYAFTLDVDSTVTFTFDPETKMLDIALGELVGELLPPIEEVVEEVDYTGMVNVPGSWQAAAGCEGDWDPTCEVTALTMGDDGLYTGAFNLPAGDYEVKVALDGGWDVNYGVDGVAGGDNFAFSLAEDGSVSFIYDPATFLLDVVVGEELAPMVNVPGSWQAAAGCEGDWDPACAVTVLTMGDDGLYTAAFTLPAGDYETKVAIGGGWDVNYGVDGVAGGDNFAFSLAAEGTVTFTYDPATNLLEIAIE